MKFFISTTILLFFLMFSSKSVSNPTDSSGNYFVDFTVDGTHYHSSSATIESGMYSKTALSLNITVTITNSDGTEVNLNGLIKNLKTTGTYNSIALGSFNWVALDWFPGNKISYVSNESTGANLSYTITEISGVVTGSFTGKLSKPDNTGGNFTYKYVNLQGTFSLPVF